MNPRQQRPEVRLRGPPRRHPPVSKVRETWAPAANRRPALGSPLSRAAGEGPGEGAHPAAASGFVSRTPRRCQRLVLPPSPAVREKGGRGMGAPHSRRFSAPATLVQTSAAPDEKHRMPLRTKRPAALASTALLI